MLVLVATAWNMKTSELELVLSVRLWYIKFGIAIITETSKQELNLAAVPP